MLGESIQQTGEIVRQASIAQSIDHQIHPQRKEDDLPRRTLDHFPGRDDVAFCGDSQQDKRTDCSDCTNWHTLTFKPEETNQQQAKDPPTGNESRSVMNGISWLLS